MGHSGKKKESNSGSAIAKAIRLYKMIYLHYLNVTFRHNKLIVL